MPSHTDLISMTAVALRDKLNSGEVTPHDCLDAIEARIAKVDISVNALPTLCFERARKHADQLMKKRPGARGLLGGIPIPIKDLTPVKGVLTTQGSPIFKDTIPAASDPLVERLETQGGIVCAKSNTPEFGAGANTFNEVFGATRNPYNTRLSAAGSSGGAAVALATGMAWLAHGSDLGGSLRNPASFCGIAGLRPTPGRVASDPGVDLDRRLPQQGPMARTVEDCALLLDAMSGEDIRDPGSLPKPTRSFLSQARSGWLPKRVAYSPDLGITPVDPEVAAITRKAAMVFASMGAKMDDCHPDFSEAHESFNVLRARSFAISKKTLLDQHRDLLKPEVIWNIEAGLKLTLTDILKAEHQRAAMFRRTLAFFEDWDLLCTPATIVAAFPVEQRYVASCNGVVFDNYVHWLSIAYAITLVGCPAISVPCGFTSDGRPVGLQIVAKPRAEGRLFAAAKALEEALDLKTCKPVDPNVQHTVAKAKNLR
jgi:amidase